MAKEADLFARIPIFMANQLALSAVTAVLKDLLNNGMIDHDVTDSIGGNVTVTSLPPDRVVIDDPGRKPQLNIFLYAVTPNTAWRNADMPAFSPSGQRINTPKLALDLHYLLTAYGVQDLQSEILLGYAMNLMHDTPVLTRSAIKAALSPNSAIGTGILPAAFRSLAADDLSNQVEPIKLVLQPMTLEEMSRLWSAFQAKYRTSTAYVASVVLIEPRRLSTPGLPVLQRRFAVLTNPRPQLDSITPLSVPSGGTLTITGSGLRADNLQVVFNTAPVAPAFGPGESLAVVVPGGLNAGIQKIKVRQLIAIGAPADPQRSFDSNTLAFLLMPVITADTPAAASQNPLQIAIMRDNLLTLGVVPSIAAEQDVQLLIGEKSLSLAPRAAGSPALPKVAFNIPSSLAPGSYLLRLRVDGAESALSTGPDGLFNGPTLTVT